MLPVLIFPALGDAQVADTFNPNPNAIVYALAAQPDGKILAGGDFTYLAGAGRSYLGRVNADGTLDTSFVIPANNSVYALALQPDGNILVGGIFTRLGGATRNYIGRALGSGILDTNFNPGVVALLGSSPSVHCLLVQEDGKILVGGSFTTLAGASRYCIGRLNGDGTIDSGFQPPLGPVIQSPYFYGVMSMAILPDGTVLACGALGDPQISQLVIFVERLNPDGSLIARPLYTMTPLGGRYVAACAPQPDGKVLLGGNFSWGSTGGIARMNADNTQDTSFVPVVSAPVYSLALQADGKVLLGGSFSTLNGNSCRFLGRLNSNGTYDSTFNPSASNTVYTLGLQGDGKALVGGSFTNVAGRPRNYFGRLSNAVATQSLTFDGWEIDWLRSGSSPEVWRTTFEMSLNGGDWTMLNDPFPVSGGWLGYSSFLVTDLGTVNIRARGYLTAANGNGSGYFVETIFGRPLLVTQPASRTNAATTTATFSTQAQGSPTLGYQWLKNGQFLTNATNISGAQSATLAVANVMGRDAGGYSVIVTNSYAYVTSTVATLTITGDPSFKVSPVNQTVHAGQNATFSTAVNGTTPIGYQWFKGTVALVDGGNVSGSAAASLTISNAIHGDAAGYSVVITNLYGSATSSVATLTVNGDLFVINPPLSQTANLQDSASFDVTAGGTPPWYYQWQKDGADISGATTSALGLTNLHAGDAAAYACRITNVYSSITSAVAVLAVNLALCDSFQPGASNLDNFMWLAETKAFVVQPDGHILLAGRFDHLGGQARNCVARVAGDGTVETNFNLNLRQGVYEACVSALTMQTDGKVLLGGDFIYYGTQQFFDLIRVDSAGAFDAAFTPAMYSAYNYAYCSSMLCQSEQRILVGGCFDRLGGQGHTNIARLYLTGAADSACNVGTEPSLYGQQVSSMAIQPDAKIVVGGYFTSLCGQVVNNIARLNTGFALDTTFVPGGANGTVNCVLVQPDGKILVGGNFTSIGGSAGFLRLARINSNGSLDLSFNPGADAYVLSLALQTDGKILVGGGFTTLAGQPFKYLGRLNPDGSPDTTFIPGADAPVSALALQADGKVLVGGQFHTLAGQPRSCVARLNNTGPATQSLTRSNSVILWQRGGTSPELWRASFEACTNGVDWFLVGGPLHVSAGWQLSGVSVSTNAAIRARGFLTSGQCNGSHWFVETILPGAAVNPLAILTADGGFGFHTNCFGFNVRAVAGQAIVIEATTNFINWVPLQTNLATSLGQVMFSDSQSGLFPKRFYRAGVYAGALPPPAILAPDPSLGFQSGRFGFHFTGIAGQTVVIEASTDLVTWAALATNVLDSTPIYFSDPSSTNMPRRFYRARLQP